MTNQSVERYDTGAENAADQSELAPHEKHENRKNEAHLRRNKSRRRHTERGLVDLECRGRFVLPEITRMQVRGTHPPPPARPLPPRSVGARPSYSEAAVSHHCCARPGRQDVWPNPQPEVLPRPDPKQSVLLPVPRRRAWWQASCAMILFTASRDELDQKDNTARGLFFPWRVVCTRVGLFSAGNPALFTKTPRFPHLF